VLIEIRFYLIFSGDYRFSPLAYDSQETVIMLKSIWQNYPSIGKDMPQSPTEALMDALTEKLDIRLRQWKPEIADQVRQRVSEIIEMADLDVLDILRPRAVEQDVLDLLDEPKTW
jgi:hypothetical protein